MTMLKINGVDVTAPSSLFVEILDIDSSDSTNRAADATLTRDRVAIKRQIEASWGILKSAQISEILQACSDIYFEIDYPDPEEGTIATRVFYVGNRKAAAALKKDEEIFWSGMSLIFTER